MTPRDIFGPATSSTLVRLDRSAPDRLRLVVSSDHGTVTGILDERGARELRDALNDLLNEPATAARHYQELVRTGEPWPGVAGVGDPLVRVDYRVGTAPWPPL